MNDYISRQAAIEWCLEGLNNMPSAQPEKRTEERAETHACDLIDRQAAIDAIQSFSLFGYIEEETEKIVNALKELPSAQPEQKKGEWVKTIKHYKDDNMEFDFYAIKCSACGEKPEKAYHLTRYCPNCGADLRGDTE